MKSLLKKTITVIVFIGVLFLLLKVYRNVQFDKGVSALKSEDYAMAVQKLKPLAKVGDADAQYLLGLMSAFGWGVTKNDAEAIKWFRKAAKWSDGSGDPAAPAAYYVGENYADGVGVQKNEAEALKWFHISAEGNYSKAAELLGKAYAEGLLGLERDPQQSQYWFKKAKRENKKK